MILTFALLAFDLFGQQIARIGDVTNDGVDEIVVTDPIGDQAKPREGRVLIIDPVKWTIVRELSGEASETQFGNLCSVARSGKRSYLAVTSVVKGEPKALVRLIDAGDFSTVWKDVIEFDSSKRATLPNPLCVIDGGDPVVFLIERSKATVDDPEHLVLWRRGLKGRTVVGRLRDGYLPDSGQNLSPHSDATGRIDGIVVSSIDHYRPPTTSGAFNGASRIDWVRVSDGATSTHVVADVGDPIIGIQVLPSGEARGRLSGDFIALSHPGAVGMRLHVLSTSAVKAVIDIPGVGSRELGPTSMCWMRDVDGDQTPDLAVGCESIISGSVAIIGSKTGAIDRVLVPEFLAEGVSAGTGDHAWHFGTCVCAIPDQDRDGEEDLLVAATIPTAGGHRAAVSVISTNTWKVIRIVYERDLVETKSEK